MYDTASAASAPQDGDVVETPISLLGDFTLSGDSSHGPLTAATLASLREFFQRETIHRPSPRMWAALADLAATLEAMAEERCPSQFYLSSLDPGVGKSETVAHFVRALLDSPDHTQVAVMICVFRLDEVRSFVSRMRLPDTMYAVFTSDKEMNQKYGVSVHDARVLFTTQQMLESRCKGNGFALAREFHYGGKARQVRIWDESMLPGKPLTVNRDDIAFLLRPLRARFPKVTEQLDALFTEVGQLPDKSLFAVPAFAEEHRVDVNEVLRALDKCPREHKDAASALWLLSGKTVVIRQDGRYGNTLLDYHETVPSDLAPVVVLDASGRVRATYEQWQTGRGNLVPLRSAAKSYRNLRVHVWQRGGGKSAFATEGQLLADAIASTMNKKPNEDWLVVCHQPWQGKFDVESQVRALLKNNDTVNFITWGNHQATNAYSHVQNIVLAGTLFYRTSHYESLGRLAAGRRPGDGTFTQKDLVEIVQGEHRHLVLQAACRGSVRLCDGDTCRPCDVYLMASVKSGIAASLGMIFPDCKLTLWQPIPKALSGKVKEAVEYIKAWFVEEPDGVLPVHEVMRAIGIRDRSNFKNNVRRHTHFVEALAELGITECGEGKRACSFMREFNYGVDEEGYVAP